MSLLTFNKLTPVLFARRQNTGPGSGCLFFPNFFCFNFCPYSPVLLFLNFRYLSFIYLFFYSLEILQSNFHNWVEF